LNEHGLEKVQNHTLNFSPISLISLEFASYLNTVGYSV
jgi:hypothetical protein